MTTLILALRVILGFDEPFTTDDTWDCYQDTQGRHVCERTIEPCHYEYTPEECVVRVTWSKTKVVEVP